MEVDHKAGNRRTIRPVHVSGWSEAAKKSGHYVIHAASHEQAVSMFTKRFPGIYPPFFLWHEVYGMQDKKWLCNRYYFEWEVQSD